MTYSVCDSVKTRLGKAKRTISTEAIRSDPSGFLSSDKVPLSGTNLLNYLAREKRVEDITKEVYEMVNFWADKNEKIFKGEEDFNPPPREKQSHRYEKPEKKFDMLLDIQEIIAE